MGAGGSGGECFTRKSDGGACCDVNNSLFGEDAFYRDAFYDCDEGNRSHDMLFATAREQARLKMCKGRMAVKYASFELKRRVSHELSQCIAKPKAIEQYHRKASNRDGSTPTAAVDTSSTWLGSTLPEWTCRGSLPPTEEGPYWAKGRGTGLRVRCGPNYVKSGLKSTSTGSMYETMTCDAIAAGAKIERVMGHLVKSAPMRQESHYESDRGGGSELQWTPDCPCPRVLCINMMLPYETGLNPWKKDGGCSFVGFFHIKPETIHALRTDNPPACVKLFKDFCAGPAAAPGAPTTDPDRTLHRRVRKGRKKDQQSGIFKAIACCENPEDVHVPDMFHTYNGKPCLITKCGYIVKDPAGEWLEIGVDVRGFNILARRMLYSFRSLLPRTKIHYGFLIQGVEDEEMPEGLLCDMYVCGVDMLKDPRRVDDLIESEAEGEAVSSHPGASASDDPVRDSDLDGGN
mmetsp:Transcript_53210/g.164932  ORF Transcript_53210/g.164932 Transcript_53210/m.164932 type:complete len:460 (+) Transcript_53210:2-1381(+)